MSKRYIHYIQDFKFILLCFKDASIMLKTLHINKEKKV